jgi:hypothetical protein
VAFGQKQFTARFTRDAKYTEVCLSPSGRERKEDGDGHENMRLYAILFIAYMRRRETKWDYFGDGNQAKRELQIQNQKDTVNDGSKFFF